MRIIQVHAVGGMHLLRRYRSYVKDSNRGVVSICNLVVLLVNLC